MPKKHEQGVIALILVIMVAAVIVVYGTSVALMSISETQTASGWLATSRSRTFTNACISNALARLRNNNTTSGNVNIAVSNVTCEAIISGSGNTRQILSSGTSTDAFARDVVHRVNVNVNIATNPFTIIEYKDILD